MPLRLTEPRKPSGLGEAQRLRPLHDWPAGYTIRTIAACSFWTSDYDDYIAGLSAGSVVVVWLDLENLATKLRLCHENPVAARAHPALFPRFGRLDGKPP